MMAAALLAGSAAPLRAQTRADSAAVLLQAAEQLRLRGETAAARAVLELLRERYAGTPAAAGASTLLGELRRAPEAERSGRTELQVFGTTMGAWVGIAVPLSVEADGPGVYGLGLLVGAPAGLLAARWYANRFEPTEGQTRAITFGGVWGTYQGLVITELTGGRTERYEYPCPTDPQRPCYGVYDAGPEPRDFVRGALAGGAVGLGVGAMLARKPITAGTAAATTLGGMWGSWFGFAATQMLGGDTDASWTGALVAGNAALLATGLAAPRWDMTESRARLISLGGLLGGLGAAGLMLIVQPDSEELVIAFPLLGSAAGLAAGAWHTRDAAAAETGGGAGGSDSLLSLERGAWQAGLPVLRPGVKRAAGGGEWSVYVPLLRARF